MNTLYLFFSYIPSQRKKFKLSLLSPYSLAKPTLCRTVEQLEHEHPFPALRLFDIGDINRNIAIIRSVPTRGYKGKTFEPIELCIKGEYKDGEYLHTVKVYTSAHPLHTISTLPSSIRFRGQQPLSITPPMLALVDDDDYTSGTYSILHSLPSPPSPPSIPQFTVHSLPEGIYLSLSPHDMYWIEYDSDRAYTDYTGLVAGLMDDENMLLEARKDKDTGEFKRLKRALIEYFEKIFPTDIPLSFLNADIHASTLTHLTLGDDIPKLIGAGTTDARAIVKLSIALHIFLSAPLPTLPIPLESYRLCRSDAMSTLTSSEDLTECMSRLSTLRHAYPSLPLPSPLEGVHRAQDYHCTLNRYIGNMGRQSIDSICVPVWMDREGYPCVGAMRAWNSKVIRVEGRDDCPLVITDRSVYYRYAGERREDRGERVGEGNPWVVTPLGDRVGKKHRISVMSVQINGVGVDADATFLPLSCEGPGQSSILAVSSMHTDHIVAYCPGYHSLHYLYSVPSLLSMSSIACGRGKYERKMGIMMLSRGGQWSVRILTIQVEDMHAIPNVIDHGIEYSDQLVTIHGPGMYSAPSLYLYRGYIVLVHVNHGDNISMEVCRYTEEGIERVGTIDNGDMLRVDRPDIIPPLVPIHSLPVPVLLVPSSGYRLDIPSFNLHSIRIQKSIFKDTLDILSSSPPGYKHRDIYSMGVFDNTMLMYAVNVRIVIL